MPAIESHSGLLRQTIPHYNKRNFVNVSNTKQFYTAFPAIQRNAKKAISNKWEKFQFGLPVKTDGSGGTSFKFNAQVASGNTFAWVDMHDPVNIDERDFQVQLDVPKRMCRNHWSYNKREMAACRGQEELTSLITSRSLACDQDFADSFENWFWGAPPASTDTRTAFPLRYWIYTEPESTVGSYSTYTSILSTANQNFLAKNHGSYTSGPGGQSRVTYPQLGNANVQYTTFNDSDFVTKLTNIVLDCTFESPVDFPNMVKGESDRAMYTTKSNYITRATLARQQNDQNGSDLTARISDNDLFRIPMYRVPQLDSPDFSLYSSSNKDVVYGIDWTTLWWASTSGFTLQDEILDPSREAPLDFTHVRYLDGQLVCTEARRNFVLSK